MSASDHALQIAAIALLVLGAAFFSASEAALISLSRLRARALIERNLRGSAALGRLVGDRNRFLTSILIGNTIVLLVADSFATLVFIRLGVPHAGILSTAVMTVVLLVFGEIVPKTIAVADAERWALRLAPILEKISLAMTPFNIVFLAATNVVVRVLGVPPTPHGPFLTEEDIRNVINVGVEQNVLEEDERRMIHSIIEFGDTIVREVMTPRPDMIAVDVQTAARRALDLVIADGYSKLPVYDKTVDDVIGVVHDRELLIALSSGSLAATSLRALMRPVTLVPESKRISELLREMQKGKFSLAIVVDEYGGTAGLVTMEDLLEEIVGEIRDEHDEGEEEAISLVAPGEAIVDAGTNIEDVNEQLGLHLPHEDFETIGGLTVGLFGRLPSLGEEVDASEGLRVKIERTRGRRILSVRLFMNAAAAEPVRIVGHG